MPSLDKDLLYVPFKSSTINSDQCSEGGSLYWYYKECRKDLRGANLLKKKATKCTQSTNSNEGKIEYNLRNNMKLTFLF